MPSRSSLARRAHRPRARAGPLLGPILLKTLIKQAPNCILGRQNGSQRRLGRRPQWGQIPDCRNLFPRNSFPRNSFCFLGILDSWRRIWFPAEDLFARVYTNHDDGFDFPLLIFIFAQLLSIHPVPAPGPWSWPLALGHGPWPWPLAMAMGLAHI